MDLWEFSDHARTRPKKMLRTLRLWDSTQWHLRIMYQKSKHRVTRSSLRYQTSCLKLEQFNNKPSKTKTGTGKYSKNNLTQFKAISTSCEIAHKTLFSNQQINFNFDTAASLLNVIYADITSYKAALYAFKTNVLNSIPTLLDQRLPMSLVPRESLLSVIDAVYKSQKEENHRLTLAIPPSDIHSYYDAKLLRDVTTIEEGLLLNLAIPYASSQTAFQIYRAHVIPMPQGDPTEAIKWVTE